MEHPCHNCNAAVQEGTAFCPNCGAPQIRVVTPEEPVSPAAGEQQGVTGAQPAQPAASWVSGGPAYPYSSTSIDWHLAWRGALLAGVGTALLSALPIISLGCCLWLLGGGALSVLLYQRKVPGLLVTPGMGLRLGAATGAFAYLLYALFFTVLGMLKSNEFRQMMQESIERAAARNSDTQSQQIAQQLIDWLGTPQGAATFIVFMLAFLAIVFVGFTAAGGALGASVFGQRRQGR